MEILAIIKDWMPSIIGVAALGISYYSISAQIRKTHRVEWIEDFRREIALFNYLASAIYVYKEAEEELQENVFLIQMFLDDRNELHKELYELMGKAMDRAYYEPKNHKKLDKIRYNIVVVAKEIIDEEKRKI